MENTGFGLLKGKKGVIFGALDDRSIAWAIAERVHEEGGTFILSNAPVAQRLGTLDSLAEKTNSQVIWADATKDEDMANLFTEAKESLGGIDFIVHAIGMGLNVRKKKPMRGSTMNGTSVRWTSPLSVCIGWYTMLNNPGP